MATEVQIANYLASGFAGPPAKEKDNFRRANVAEAELLMKIARDTVATTGEAPAPEVIAHGVEFVASPGEAIRIQRAIPEAMRNTLGSSESFAGCMVLVSEQEARLVTVITLWTGRERVEQCNENSERVERVLAPYVDRFLRTRTLAAFLSTR